MSVFDYRPGWREPIYFEDFLVEVWRFQSVGRDDDGRRLLAGIWSWAMDNGRADRDVRVALRLLERLAPVTDDPPAWAELPAVLRVWRAETSEDMSRGLCWTLDRGVAEMHAARHGLRITDGLVAKSDVLAYLTNQGEEEIVVRRTNVKAPLKR